METFTFTLSDSSTKPYAWMIENVDSDVIDNVSEFVEDYARNSINALNYSDLSDEQVYQVWRNDTSEFEQAVQYITTAQTEN